MMDMEVNGSNIRVKLEDNRSAEAERITEKRPFYHLHEGLCSHGEVRQLRDAAPH